MALENTLNSLATRIRQHSETIATEEAAKTSIILPFLQALGYDVFNPGEVIPEFTADAVGKRGEKVDYAIKLDGKIQILIECKGLNAILDRRHLSQLFRYFTVTDAKFAILTNGRVYQFYTDLDEPNKLDARPFFVADLLDLTPQTFSELAKFEKSSFDVGRILQTAERLKYVLLVKKLLQSEMENPGEEVVRYVASNIHEGRLTSQVKETFQVAIRSAFKEIVRDAIQARLSSALAESSKSDDEEVATEISEIETTQDEIEGLLTIKSIVRDIISVERVGLRDARSYCAVLVDDNNRKPLARMHFDRKNWYLSLFDGDSEERVPLADLNGIYTYADRIRATAERYRVV